MGVSMIADSLVTSYEQMRKSTVALFRPATILRITGRDRAVVLNNLCTNQIRGLPTGSGCEAFVTTVQGKILGHVLVYAREEDLILTAVAGQAPVLMQHIDRYTVSEDVQCVDDSGTGRILTLIGPSAAGYVQRLGIDPPKDLHGHRCVPSRFHLPGGNFQDPKDIEGRGGATSVLDNLACCRGPLDDPDCYSIILHDASAATRFQELLATWDLPLVDEAVFEMRRVERGWPVFGVDFSERNLPQEVDRDRLAINFAKGCYLGQETVARIDALGQVQRLLRGVRFDGDDPPPPDTTLRLPSSAAEGLPEKVVGEATSVVWSPAIGSYVGLGILRREAATPGSVVTWDHGTATVTNLPFDLTA